jgi:hypothetical protein
MALSEKEKREVERDAQVDSQDDTRRQYKGSPAADIIFAPVDALAGTQSSSDHAHEKQEYYNELRDARDRR